MLKKKERYATLVTDLDTHKPIAVIKGRNTLDVQEFLNTLPNLKYVSRDRAHCYKNLDRTLCHIADQFHILQNASDVIAKVVTSTLPSFITVDSEEEATAIGGEKIKTPKLIGNKLVKYNLIMRVKSEYEKYGSYAQVARELDMNHRTVKVYCELKDPKSWLLKRRKTRVLKWDEYKREITDLLKQGYSVKKVYEKLFSDMPDYKFGTLRHYCRELNIGGNRNTKNCNIDSKNIANFISGFSYNRDKLLSNFQKLEDDVIITECAVLIARLKSAFNHKDISEFKSLFDYEFTNKKLINFIKGLDSDYDAIINSILTNYNNSIQEGMVNKVKSIKKEMYGRCSLELLTIKILFWSIT